MLTAEQMREAVTLAMKIEIGDINYNYVLDTLRCNPSLATDLVYFWMTFNSMTRNAVQTLVTEKCRLHLEACWSLTTESEDQNV